MNSTELESLKNLLNWSEEIFNQSINQRFNIFHKIGVLGSDGFW
jgi:hypothetical protein